MYRSALKHLSCRCRGLYRGYPIVVLSADRPTYQIPYWEVQTIRQQEVFSKHIIYETSLQDVTHNQAAIIDSNPDVN